MNNIKWIFFDVGSTLIDETEYYNHRIRGAVAGNDIIFEEFNEKRIFFAKHKPIYNKKQAHSLSCDKPCACLILCLS